MRVGLRASILVGGTILAVGCATGGSQTMSAADAIEARQKLMKEQGAAFRTINESLKAGRVQAVVPEAEKLTRTAKQIPSLFPPGSTSPTSRAKPEIWQDWSRFEGYAKALEASATRLAATARGGDAQATQAAFTAVNREACAACHDAFRTPPKK